MRHLCGPSRTLLWRQGVRSRPSLLGPGNGRSRVMANHSFVASVRSRLFGPHFRLNPVGRGGGLFQPPFLLFYVVLHALLEVVVTIDVHFVLFPESL